jgi:hypothetical protein
VALVLPRQGRDDPGASAPVVHPRLPTVLPFWQRDAIPRTQLSLLAETVILDQLVNFEAQLAGVAFGFLSL